MKKAAILIPIIIFFFSIILSIQAKGASLFLSPGSETFLKGDVFSVEVKVDTDLPINAAQTTVYFPPDKLEVLDIFKENSIFLLWPEEPAFSNTLGEISFSGGLPSPGFTGVGNIITISFKAKGEGRVSLTLGEGRVLADDGKGTDILVFLREAKYSVQKPIVPSEIRFEIPPTKVPPPPQILCLTHSQKEEWYNNNNPRFQWELTPDITGLSFVLDHNPDTVPDTGSEGIFGSQTFSGLDDGVWYFHLRVKNEIGWSEPAHRKIQVDSLPPRPFEIIIDNAGDFTNPSPDLYFETVDDTSGVNYYKLKIGRGDFLDLMLAQINPFSLPSQSPGRHQLIARAIDEAGNAVEAEAILDVEPIESPQVTLLPQKYIAAEETLYIEGTALPEVEVIIFLKKNGKEIKRWSTVSNNQGEWLFSTRELIKSGVYDLLVKARDKRGAESTFSEGYKIEVFLSGISWGPFIIAFRTLTLFLALVLCLGIIAGGYLTYRTWRGKKMLTKETHEAKESVREGFKDLRKEIEERIRMFDSKPEFSEEEKKVYEDLKKYLKVVEQSIEKEVKDIEDIEKGLKERK